jgi:hypothetical protein
MISSETFNNFKYYSKVVVILLVVFLLLRFMLEIKPQEGILLACIIAVSVLIIENIIYINANASDPLNCDQCKVSVVDSDSKTESKPKEEFIGNLSAHINDLYNNVVNKVLPNTPATTVTDSPDKVLVSDKKTLEEALTNSDPDKSDKYEYKCIRVLKSEHSDVKPEANSVDHYNNGSDDVAEGFEQFIENQAKINTELKPVSSPAPEPKQMATGVTHTNDAETEGATVPYSANYVQYQQDGLQKAQNKVSEEINKFRREIADQEAVIPWTNEGYKYYADIFTRSVGAPPASEALTNELKYGDYNYIGPINKGMINKEYTFVSPTNWYPIPPHPPVCVTNKSCTTCPVQISNGKDYMQWANWEDFDQARRFTGDMGINIDYVKNVLNNPNGF